MISVEQARSLVAASVPIPQAEEIDAADADGRILAQPFVALSDLPRFDNAAMDGYALRAADVAEASVDRPRRLRVVGVCAARSGALPTIRQGECVQVMTGARLPAGGDAVVMAERTSGHAGDSVQVFEAAQSGQNIRRRGEEVSAGARLLRAGERLGPAELGAIAAFGCASVSVHRRPRLALLVSGDELRQASDALAPGETYDATSPVLLRAARADADVVFVRPTADDPAQLDKRVREAALVAELVVISGGVSIGRFDQLREVSKGVGFEERFCGVTQEPGRPLFFAATNAGQLLFGLPGDPVSALICFVEYVTPTLRLWQGAQPAQSARARLLEPFPRLPDRHRFLLGTAHIARRGLEVTPSAKHGLHMISAALGANCICSVPAGEEPLDPGAPIAVTPLPWALLHEAVGAAPDGQPD